MYKLLIAGTLLAMVGTLIASGISVFKSSDPDSTQDPKLTARLLGWRVFFGMLLMLEVVVGVLTGALKVG